MRLRKVLLVDDLALYADAVAVLLSDVPDLLLLGRYTTSDPTLIRDVANLRPDVVLLDVQPLGRGAGSLLSDLHRAWPRGALVVLTGSRDTALAVAAAHAGVTAWIDKDTASARLVEILRGVCVGQAWFPPTHLGAILREFRSMTDAGQRERRRPVGRLSRRERDVLAAVVAGKSVDVIARELQLGQAAARSCISNILVQLGVDGRLAAASVAARSVTGPNDVGRSDDRDVVDVMRPDDSSPSSCQ
jgi:two-component system, NarL family, response regulator LiaR